MIPHIATEKTLALKGGTAINLFLRNMPRLSADIDLTYLKFDNRKTALSNISDSLGRIRERIVNSIPGTTVNNLTFEGNDVKLFVQSEKAFSPLRSSCSAFAICTLILDADQHENSRVKITYCQYSYFIQLGAIFNNLAEDYQIFNVSI